VKPFIKKFGTPFFDLYPIGDLHLGSQQCDDRFVKQVIDEIADNEDAYWCGMGDLIENALPTSLGDMYTQVLSPEAQLDRLIEWFEPIKEKGLFMIRGNHEDRTYKAVGQRPERYIERALGKNPRTGKSYVPFLGISCYAKFMLNSKTPKSFRCLFHHNTGGGGTMGGKVNRSMKLRPLAPSADAIFSGHTHITDRKSLAWSDIGDNEITKKRTIFYVIGSTLTYDESYAETKALLPACKELIKVRFKGATTGKRDNRAQDFHIILPEK
jgi:hypothetical protein